MVPQWDWSLEERRPAWWFGHLEGSHAVPLLPSSNSSFLLSWQICTSPNRLKPNFAVAQQWMVRWKCVVCILTKRVGLDGSLWGSVQIYQPCSTTSWFINNQRKTEKYGDFSGPPTKFRGTGTFYLFVVKNLPYVPLTLITKSLKLYLRSMKFMIKSQPINIKRYWYLYENKRTEGNPKK